MGSARGIGRAAPFLAQSAVYFTRGDKHNRRRRRTEKMMAAAQWGLD